MPLKATIHESLSFVNLTQIMTVLERDHLSFFNTRFLGRAATHRNDAKIHLQERSE